MQKPWTIAAVFATALFTASCGGGGSSTPTSPTTPPAGGVTNTITIAITGQGGKLAFSPNPATVAPDQLVVFKNNDVVAHHVMLDDGATQTPDIPAGGTSAAVSIGTNKSYHCTIHPGMVGGFNGTQVEPPPNCSQAYCSSGG
jgi:plastocyanin